MCTILWQVQELEEPMSNDNPVGAHEEMSVDSWKVCSNSLNELRQIHWANSNWRGCVFPAKCLDTLDRMRENKQSERWWWRWTPCSCLLCFAQMPYNNRHKRNAAGCRFCCGCCPNMSGCGVCCRFWGFLHQPGISTTTTKYWFVVCSLKATEQFLTLVVNIF